MKVSVIICTKDRPELLMERSLPSVLSQSFTDYEIVIVDDASIERYPWNELRNRYKVVKNYVHKGLAYSRNAGAREAEGKYIVFLDDDNEFHEDFLKETVHFIESCIPSKDAVGVGKVIVYPEGRIHQEIPRGDYFAMNDGFLINKEAYERVLCDEGLQGNEDADFGMRFLRSKFTVGFVEKELMTVYGSHIFNKTSYSDYSDYHLEGMVRFWLKHKNYFMQNRKENDYIKDQIGRYFLISSGRRRWFRWGYWMQEKYKRYKAIGARTRKAKR